MSDPNLVFDDTDRDPTGQATFVLNRAAEQGFRPTLEIFPNQFAGRRYYHHITCEEFTSMCPRTGQPDYGKVHITYVAAKHCVELKSLKLYLQSYRTVGIFYENMIHLIYEDFYNACLPEMLEVRLEMTPRGGIHSQLVRRSDGGAA